MSEAAPAFRAYTFDKAYRDVGTTLRRAWQANLRSARQMFARAAERNGNDARFEAVWAFGAACSVFLLGSGAAIVLAAGHLAIVLLASTCHGTLVAGAWLTERAFLLVRRFRVECPACHQTSRLPVHHCPTCAAKHPWLEPGLSGAFTHRCRCGTFLSSWVFTKRAELPSSCRRCGHALQVAHFLSNKTHIGLVGGPSVGKSTFLYASVSQLMARWQAEGGTAELVEGSTRRTFEDAARRVAAGESPQKTFDRLPTAFHVKFTRASGEFRIVYLYDAAGEVWQEAADLPRHVYQDRMAGVLLLVDPFTQREVQSAIPEDVIERVLPSRLAPLASLQALVLNLDRLLPNGGSGPRRVSMAVVLTKVDALPTSLARRLDRLDEAAADWGLSPTLDLAGATFTPVQLFASAALRRDDGPAPTGVVEPLLWLLRAHEPAFWGGVAEA